MNVNEIHNPVREAVVIHDYTSYNDATTSKTSDVFTLPRRAALLGLTVEVKTPFITNNRAGIQSATTSNWINVNISSLGSGEKRQYVFDPPSTQSTSGTTVIQNTLTSNSGFRTLAGTVNISRTSHGGTGTATAGLIAGGTNGTGMENTSESFDGISWTLESNMPNAKQSSDMAGSQNSAIEVSGFVPGPTYSAITHEYDGSVWSSGGNVNTAARWVGTSGTLDAGLLVGGYNDTTLSRTEEYNGTSWTSGNNLSSAREQHGICGIQSASIAMGGWNSTGYFSTTEEYDGVTWASGGNINSQRRQTGSAGSTGAGLLYSGANAASLIAASETYNGTSWTNSGSMITSRWSAFTFGDQSNAIAGGGQDLSSNRYTSVEEYSIQSNLSNLASGEMIFRIKYLQYEE